MDSRTVADDAGTPVFVGLLAALAGCTIAMAGLITAALVSHVEVVAPAEQVSSATP